MLPMGQGFIVEVIFLIWYHQQCSDSLGFFRRNLTQLFVDFSQMYQCCDKVGLT